MSVNIYKKENRKFIFKNFNCNNIKDKIENKLSLQKELGLPQKEDTPMIGLISRLTHQKGCDLIVSIIDRLLQKDIQFVVLGTGDYWYEETFKITLNLYSNAIIPATPASSNEHPAHKFVSILKMMYLGNNINDKKINANENQNL